MMVPSTTDVTNRCPKVGRSPEDGDGVVALLSLQFNAKYRTSSLTVTGSQSVDTAKQSVDIVVLNWKQKQRDLRRKPQTLPCLRMRQTD